MITRITATIIVLRSFVYRVRHVLSEIDCLAFCSSEWLSRRVLRKGDLPILMLICPINNVHVPII